MAEPEEKHRFDALEDRRRSVRIPSRHHVYSSLVNRLRWVLPVLVLGIVAALMIWPKIQVEIAERRFAPSPIDRAALERAATENRLLNANFSSIDAKGRPFTLTASEAVQKNNDPDLVVLQKPRGTLKSSDTETMTGEAERGLYAQGKQHLTLTENVVLTRSDGTTMKTEKLFVNMATNDARTDVPVVIEGPQGKLTAQGMDMKNGGASTIFTGPAKLILNSNKSIDPAGS
jgi:lipopolysaccharide export system protein LptC